MNKVKGRRTKDRKGREKLELGAFLSGGVGLHSRGFWKIFCFSCSVFIYNFFSPVSRSSLWFTGLQGRLVTFPHCYSRCYWGPPWADTS